MIVLRQKLFMAPPKVSKKVTEKEIEEAVDIVKRIKNLPKGRRYRARERVRNAIGSKPSKISARPLGSQDFVAPENYRSKRIAIPQLMDDIHGEVPMSERLRDYKFREHWDPRIEEYVTNPSPQAQKVFDNYANAMNRKRNYVWEGLPEKLDYGEMYGFKRKNSAVFGFNNNGVFVASHFAPENLPEGYKLIKDIRNSKHPAVFAVTGDLSKQLEKAGFTKVGQIPQIFAGETVMKDVMINPVTTQRHLEMAFPMIPKGSITIPTPQLQTVQKSTVPMASLVDEATVNRLRNIT